jgi:hypothetical protein
MGMAAVETAADVTGEGDATAANFNGVDAEVAVPLAGELEVALTENVGAGATALESPEGNLNKAGTFGATTFVLLADGGAPCESPTVKDVAAKVEGDAHATNGSTDPVGNAVVDAAVADEMLVATLLAGGAANSANDVLSLADVLTGGRVDVDLN